MSQTKSAAAYFYTSGSGSRRCRENCDNPGSCAKKARTWLFCAMMWKSSILKCSVFALLYFQSSGKSENGSLILSSLVSARRMRIFLRSSDYFRKQNLSPGKPMWFLSMSPAEVFVFFISFIRLTNVLSSRYEGFQMSCWKRAPAE